VNGKKCSQLKNSTNKLSNHQKLTIARLRRVVSKTHDEEAGVKSIQRRLAGWKDFRSNIALLFLAIVSGFAGLYVFFPV
jgi:site-specific recombinase XerC